MGEIAWTGCVRAKLSLVASHSETWIPERFSFKSKRKKERMMEEKRSQTKRKRKKE